MLVLFCVVKKTRMAELMQKATGFSINILREDQQALSTYYYNEKLHDYEKLELTTKSWLWLRDFAFGLLRPPFAEP
jgi:flavin reductase (DIM6/NTAB) family NADH-FMN oxidoreductase RutF